MSDSASSPTEWIQTALRKAFQALTEGRLGEAGALCRQVLEAAPELAEAHFLVGLVALELKDRRTAYAAFSSVTRLRPNHGAAWAHLAWLAARAGQVAESVRALGEAMTHAGSRPAVADLIGTTCSLLGDQAGARTWYRRAAAAVPDRVDYRINLANAEFFLGDAAAAETELRAVLAAVPDHAQAHWLLASLRPAGDRQHVDALERLIARGDQTDRQLAFLCYGLGKALEDLGEWEAAFAAYARGAAHRRATVTFDEAAEAALFECMQRHYTGAWLAGRESGVEDPAPIFIIGQPRTGTTLVERIIASHSAVHAAGELQQFGLTLRRLDGQEGPRLSAALMARATTFAPARLGRAYLDGCMRLRGDTPHFIDKLPGNFLHVPLILAALPRARIVHLVRDPLDACFASFKQLFADAYPHSYDQAEQARHYIRYHELMAHWRREFPGRFLDVGYEALVEDPETGARRLIDYLELPWEDACLDFHRLAGPVATASAAQVREPAHTRSVGRWRYYAQQLEPMRRELAAAGLLSD